MDVPSSIEALVDELAQIPGVVAVTLGGSRAAGEADDASDWDLGVYYREAIDLGALRTRGTVYPPGVWGRLMNGGAWLSVEGAKLDVVLRDLGGVEAWCARDELGEFEVDGLLGYMLHHVGDRSSTSSSTCHRASARTSSAFALAIRRSATCI